MQLRGLMSLALCALLPISGVRAAVTLEEARQLGTSLTPMGALRVGNKDGSIPEYSGGLTTLPPTFKKGSGIRPDPYGDEQPLFSIDAKNMGKYSDRLTDGTKALLQRHPGFRLDVFKTHRSVALPTFVLENTQKNATECRLVEGGLAIEGCRGGIPFPIPKNGNEAMWNHLLAFKGVALESNIKSTYVNSVGRPVLATQIALYTEYPYYDPNTSDNAIYWKIRADYKAPARSAGNIILVHDSLNPVANPRRAWRYLSGQRRMKLAPEAAYDSPEDASGGTITYDDVGLFNGKLDRYEFKLLGRREVFMPYNTYKLAYECTSENLFQPNFLNPDCVRWELRRVWVVEATLKSGKSHIYAKRVFYWDEDSWAGGMSDQYDVSGDIFRAGFLPVTPSYDIPAPQAEMSIFYDLKAGMYILVGHSGENGGVRHVSPRPSFETKPEALAGSGVR